MVEKIELLVAHQFCSDQCCSFNVSQKIDRNVFVTKPKFSSLLAAAALARIVIIFHSLLREELALVQLIIFVLTIFSSCDVKAAKRKLEFFGMTIQKN